MQIENGLSFVDNDGDELHLDLYSDGTSLIGVKSDGELNYFEFDNVNDYDKVIGLLIQQRELLNKKKGGKKQ